MPLKGAQSTQLFAQSTQLFAQLTANLITGLPQSQGYDSGLVVVDQGLTKGVIFASCTQTIEAARVPKIFINRVCRQYGLHDSLVADQGPQFTSKFSKEMSTVLGIKLNLLPHITPTQMEKQND